ncbi:hypothetical protein EAH57_15030 [Acinetobacter sp. 2JN-4]|uniref:hypothetical protein n=1 Tax=Acinetobacter sp. 2JN-4 TaxID=2479844 RepID=UPI000EF9FE50|nr:hypothetical protein [Acinetobacter sp. 2JN-4]RLZ06841.1 hypothetical protein EAH57_15030 [Acinetobacter sp. 2JN-4]
MKERPILFSTEMVKAILEGCKTQTRRIMRRQPDAVEYFKCGEETTDTNAKYAILRCYNNPNGFKKCASGWSADARYKTPFHEFNVGDQLWVRETWQIIGDPATLPCQLHNLIYRADYPNCVDKRYDTIPDISEVKFKPSIHMPRWASRIQLEITNIRVERLNDISESDCLKEGVGSPILRDCKKPKFMQLWESINGGGSWSRNPWVWVVEFKIIQGGGV